MYRNQYLIWAKYWTIHKRARDTKCQTVTVVCCQWMTKLLETIRNKRCAWKSITDTISGFSISLFCVYGHSNLWNTTNSAVGKNTMCAFVKSLHSDEDKFAGEEGSVLQLEESITFIDGPTPRLDLSWRRWPWVQTKQYACMTSRLVWGWSGW